MLTLKNTRVFCGDFHTHWMVHPHTPSLFMAIMNWYDASR